MLAQRIDAAQELLGFGLTVGGEQLLRLVDGTINVGSASRWSGLESAAMP